MEKAKQEGTTLNEFKVNQPHTVMAEATDRSGGVRFFQVHKDGKNVDDQNQTTYENLSQAQSALLNAPVGAEVVQIDVFDNVIARYPAHELAGKLTAHPEPQKDESPASATMWSKWTREQRLAAAGLVVGVATIVAAFVVPEVRRKLGLEKPAPVSSQAQQVLPPERKPAGTSDSTGAQQPPPTTAKSTPGSAAYSAPKPDRPKASLPKHGVVIEQHSEGANSPNTAVIGDNNRVNVNPDPTQAVVTYMYDGDQRITRPGLTTDNPDNPQAKAFPSMKAAHQAKNWTLLKSLCETQIREAPDWLTPLLYKAEAEINLGNVDESIKTLDQFLTKAAGNQDYEEAIQHGTRESPKMRGTLQFGCRFQQEQHRLAV